MDRRQRIVFVLWALTAAAIVAFLVVMFGWSQ